MNRTVYFSNSFVSEKDAHIPITTHALHYGTGCFEGIRAYFSKKDNALYIFRLEDHYQRLLLSCKMLFIRLPHSINELCRITTELVEKNFDETDLYIRPLAYKSDPAVGNFNLTTLKDGFLIYTTPLGRYLNVKNGIRATFSSWTRISDNAIPPRGKVTGSYVNTALAKTDSLLSGYEEALFLDRDGHVVEGSAENLFMVRDNNVITPPVSADILQGITRDTIITLVKNELSLPVTQRVIDRTELFQADEVLLVGTGAEVSPVIEIDGRKIGSGSIGPVSQKLQEIYFQLVHGEYPKYENFLTKITKK